MLPLKNYLKHPALLGCALLEHFGKWLPDRVYLKLMFRFKMGYRLNLKNPKTFSEKIQWLKLYNRRPEYTKMVDKYAVKEYVSKLIGEEYVIPTLAVWGNPEDIDLKILPDKFVLKTTHGGGSEGVVICKNKEKFDRQKAIEQLHLSYDVDIYKQLREWPYKNVPRRIIAEQYISPASQVNDLPDYKWYCFAGEPRFCQIIQDRSTKETIDFFDTDWRHQEFIGLNPKAIHAAVHPSCPKSLETQIRIAKKLSKGIPFVRIDLYEVDGQVYFGEMTFSPGSGFGNFSPKEYNDILGRMLNLPNDKMVFKNK